jgi:adenylate kinase
MAPVEGMDKLRSSKLPIIWVLGGPGSGKGTQCERLVKRYDFQHLSSGDLLRAEVASGSDLGKSLTDTMAKGQLVSREVVLELIKNAMLKEVASAKGYLIDGYPREVEQGEEFESNIAPCSLILYFDCSDESMKARLLARAVSSGRSDDNEETIVKRLDTFHKVSEPVMEKYSTKVAKIDANTDTDTIFAKCRDRVDGLLKDLGVEVPA